MLQIPLISFEKTPADFKRLLWIFVKAVHIYFDVTLTQVQIDIAAEILFRVLLRKRHTIVISACRQIGKTEVVCYMVWFLSLVFPHLEGEPFKVVVTAPEARTGSEVYDRTKSLFDRCAVNYPNDFRFKQKNLDKLVLFDGSSIETFGLFKQFARREDKKSTKEGRTYHVAIRDEMHLGDDSIFKDDVEPALSTTGGIDIWLGNGGYRNCRAKELCDTKDRKDLTVFKYDFNYMKEEALREYKRTGNEMFMRWLTSQYKYIEDYSEQSDEVQKNLFLKWLVTVGNFTTPEELYMHRRDIDPVYFPSTIADIGLDFAKSDDETVLTLLDYETNIRDWQVFHGDWPDQVEAIARYVLTVPQEKGVQVRNIFCDSTGVGDPVTSYLRRQLGGRPPVHGIVFNAQSKDKLGKKGIFILSQSDPAARLTYPMNHPLRPTFERQLTRLEKGRNTGGLLTFAHPDKKGEYDDYADSLFLASWNIERVHRRRLKAARASLEVS